MDIIGFLNDVTGGNLLWWKVFGTTGVFMLAGAQMFLAARLWPVTTAGPISQETASVVHRWLGRVTLVVAIIVAIACIAGPAGPVSPTRALLHSIFGTLFLLVVAAKFTILRVLRKGEDLLPYVGSALFLIFAVLWVTSVADYVTG
jgi:dipeptide/tripeptide permease